MSQDSQPDTGDDLRAVLRAHSPEPPVQAVDWSALHSRITADAQPLLRRPSAAAGTGAALPSWWQLLAGWSPRAIPLAAAAAVLLVLGIGVAQRDVVQDDAGFLTLEEHLAASLPAGSRPLVAGLEADALLDVALFYDSEDWR